MKIKQIKQILSSKRRGRLLKKGKGLTSSSDSYLSGSESSSSVSKRQQKKKYFPSKLFQKINHKVTKSGDDGYESESDASAGSIRSTSSSFIRYQNKFIKLRAVFERRGDGSEHTVESKSRLPNLFDRIYKRQNTLDDNYASDESEEETSTPAEVTFEEDLCSELTSQPVVGDATIIDASEESGIVVNGEDKINTPAETASQRKKKRTMKTSPSQLQPPTPCSIPRTISYSLRSAIPDGSKRERNSHSLMEKRALRVNGCHIDTSYWSHRGKRAYMEDRYVIEYVSSTSKDCKDAKPISLFGVFDGHGGATASQFCSDWLSSYIRKDSNFPADITAAMKSAFTTIDEDFISSGYLDGSTACAVSIIGNEKVICCNVGDSRAIIVKRDGSFIPLSNDHKPERNDETTRINNLGGRVIHWGRWRVEGVLAVSRGIGDARLKPFVTAEAEVVEHNIQDDDMFIVIASDGVWDTMSSDLVAKFCLVNTCKIVEKDLVIDESLFRWIARQISKRARENGSSDNTSVIVANLCK